MAAVTSQGSRRSRLGGLPTEMTSFVGRRHELAEAKRLLSQSRVVTLTGPGGVGKTRLALRVAAEVHRAFPDGVWVVDLAALDDPGVLSQTVAEALDVRDWSSKPSLEVLAERLRNKQMLIVLDNCEHLLQACAVLVATLTRETSDLRVLATSRQPLRVTGEQVFPVPTMALPDMGDRPPPPQSVAEYDAVRLFAERAVSVVPTFTVTEDNQETVERICRRLDGIPLAIELAAVRLRALSLDQLLDRLDQRFRLLTSGSRTALPRHRTLRALIDWSYDLCTEQERSLWARVSVFSGGLDLDAAEEVCSGEDIARDDVIDLVIRLVDKSILVADDDVSPMRYRLLDTIRHYGREQLAASGQEAAVRRRHRDYYRNLAAEMDRRLFGPEETACFLRLQREHANLRAALEYCFAEGDTDIGLRMATDLRNHWLNGYFMKEGRHWLDRGLTAEREPTGGRAMALSANAWLAIIQGKIDCADAMLTESRAIGERLGLDRVLGYASIFLGGIALFRGDSEKALACYGEALDRLRSAGDPLGEALTLVRLCVACSVLGDSSATMAYARRCIELCDAYKEHWLRSYAEIALGIEYWRRGDTARAADLEKKGLRSNTSYNNLLGVGLSCEVLSWIAATEKRHQRAGLLLGALQNIWGEMGIPMGSYAYLMRYHDECEALTRAAIGEAAFRGALAQGAKLSSEDAIAYALEEAAPKKERAEPPAEASPLTRRETEIAQLVAQGMSNKEIATTLVIAQRTAEGHIEHILGKLGFNSRTQIAVWVEEQKRSAEKQRAGAS